MKNKLENILTESELNKAMKLSRNTPERFRELLVQFYTKDKEDKESIKWNPEKVFLIVPAEQEHHLRGELIDYLDKNLYKDLIQEIKEGVLFDAMKELSWIKVTGFADEIHLWQEPQVSPFYMS